MIDKTLRRESYNEYKKHIFSSWILSFFLIVVIGALITLSFLYEGSILLITPLLIFPIIFASYLAHLGFSRNYELTFKSFCKYFVLFFKSPNNGTFKFLTSLLKYFVCTLILEAVFSSVAAIICLSLDYEGFIKMAFTFYEASMNNFIISNPAEVFEETYSLYELFTNITTISTTITAGIYMFYVLLLNSLSFYLRVNIRQANNQMVNLVFKHALKKDRHVIRNNFLNLEWPILILFIIGNVAGALFTLIFTQSPDSIIMNATITGTLSTFFFLPFHFTNMEVLYKRFEPLFINSVNEVSYSLFGETHQSSEEKEKQDEE